MDIEQRVKDYWTQRSQDFGTVRKNELENEMGQRWRRELEAHLPQGRPLKILDVGTGTGFFPILLAEMGHLPQGIDLTPAMLREARAAAAQRGLSIPFLEMDAQNLEYSAGTFDVVLSRNLTWTLPELQQECDSITLELDVGKARPKWDEEVLKKIGFQDVQVDAQLGRRLLGALDLTTAPMFGIYATK